MPTLWTIVSYWLAVENHPLRVEADGIEVPFCFACGAEPRRKVAGSLAARWNGAVGYLERAHLVDRCFGGLDGPQNLVPLCGLCHKVMPAFHAEQAGDVIRWVVLGGRLSTTWRMGENPPVRALIPVRAYPPRSCDTITRWHHSARSG